MEVILLEKVQNLGDLGDKVKVRPGYGRNYLIPNKKAVPATAENIAEIEAKRAELEKAQKEVVAAAQIRAESINGQTVTIEARAGQEGKLFGSVGTTEIADALTAAGSQVEKREVRLPEGPLRAVGDHAVSIQLHGDVVCEITVSVAPEGGVLEDSDPLADDDADDDAGDDDAEPAPTPDDAAADNPSDES